MILLIVIGLALVGFPLLYMRRSKKPGGKVIELDITEKHYHDEDF